ncbi:MAG: hypothetical protein ACI9NQ_000112 [Paracoccaceae bacterium]|jgi:hypothetical protein
MIAERIPALAKLTKEEKVLLAAELWADAEGVDEVAEPNPKVLQLLIDRLAQYQSNPDSAISWDAFRKTLKAVPNG